MTRTVDEVRADLDKVRTELDESQLAYQNAVDAVSECEKDIRRLERELLQMGGAQLLPNGRDVAAAEPS